MIKTIDPTSLRAFLETAPRVLITMHRGPDGDAIGSSLGFYHILKYFGIEAVVVAPDAYPEFLHWLPDNQRVINFDRQPEKATQAVESSDVIFCLDFNSPSRMDAFEETVVNSGKKIYVVDHHESPQPFAEAYYVDNRASSTAEMIYRLVVEMSIEEAIDEKAALCLYAGLVTDTGSFRFSSVTPEVMRIAAALLDKGIDHTQVYDRIFDSHTEKRMRLYGYAISEKLKVLPEAKAAYIWLTEEELKRFDSRKGDTEGLVNEALSIRGIEIAGFFYEREGKIRVSLRSKGKIDVSSIATDFFNGGGHINAAGGLSELNMQDTLGKFENILRERAEQKTEVR